jgi:hypothetical protein
MLSILILSVRHFHFHSSAAHQLDVVVDVAEDVAEGADPNHFAKPAVDADALVCVAGQHTIMQAGWPCA